MVLNYSESISDFGVLHYIGISFCILLAFVIVKVFLHWRTCKIAWEQNSVVPGPKPTFPLGSAGILAKYGPIHGWQKVIDGGDKEQGISTLWFFSRQQIIVTHWEHLKKVFAVSPHHGPPGGFYSKPQNSTIASWLGIESILFIDSDRHNDWVRTRRLLGRTFITTRLSPLAPRMVKQIHRIVDYLNGVCEVNAGSNQPIDIEDVVYALTFDLLGASAFSKDFKGIESLSGGDKHQILKSFEALLEQTTYRSIGKTMVNPLLRAKYLWVPLPKNIAFKKHRDFIKNSILQIISDRREELKAASERGEDPNKLYDDFLNTLVCARDEESNGYKLSNKTLTDNLITVLFAGHDTTATNLTYIFYCIAKYPQVQKKLQEEVDQVFAKTQGDLTYESLRELEYTDMVMKEALRLYPPVHITIRTLSQATEIGGYQVPKHSTILIPMWHAQRDPHNWKDPEKFDPERHAPGNDNPFYAWIPFAGGARNCIGQRFANMSTNLIVAHLVHSFEYILPEDYVMESVDVGPMQRPKDRLKMIVKKRAH